MWGIVINSCTWSRALNQQKSGYQSKSTSTLFSAVTIAYVICLNSSDLKKIFQQSSITSSPQLNNRSVAFQKLNPWSFYNYWKKFNRKSVTYVYRDTCCIMSCNINDYIKIDFKMNPWCPLAPIFFPCFIYLLFLNSIVMTAVYEALSHQSEGTS